MAGEKKQNQRQIGTAYEDKAVLFLRQKDFQILERNVSWRQGEIDIVARDGAYLVFVEVKSRKSGSVGDVLEMVTPEKRRRMIKTARWYLYQRKLGEQTPCRFDVIGFCGGEMIHIKNAFDAF